MLKFTSTLLFVSFIFHFSNAQFWELGGMAGTSFYHGDLAPDFSMQSPGINASFFIRRNLDERISLRGGLSFSTLAASDARSDNAFQQARNLSFQTQVYEVSALVEFNFLPYHFKRGKKGPGAYSPYLLAGGSGFYFDPKARYNGALYPLQALGTEGQEPGSEYSLFQGSIILGAGIKVDITQFITLSIEGSTRILFTDFLDDVSGTYANPRLIENYRGSLGSVAVALSDRSAEVGDIIGDEGRQRGNPNNNDGFTHFSIGITYSIWSLNCPTY